MTKSLSTALGNNYVKLLFRFILWLIVAVALSITLLSANILDLNHKLSGYKITDELKYRYSILISYISKSAEDHNNSEITGINYSIKQEKSKESTHSDTTPLLAFLQITSVIALSFSWFYAFSLKAVITERHGYLSKVYLLASRWLPILATMIPVLIFVVAMHGAYQPAVLVMALIAILVAAEHYSGLKAQEHSLQKQGAALVMQATQLNKAQSVVLKTSTELAGISRSTADTSTLLRQAHEKIVGYANELTKIRDGTERILTNLNLDRFVQEIYSTYRSASIIYAVVRIHDIDPHWWNSQNTVDPWSEYVGNIETTRSTVDSGLQVTLLEALSINSTRSELHAHFVTDLPFLNSEDYIRRVDDGRHLFFSDPVGLAWQLVIIGEIRGKLQDNLSITATVSRPLCWMHVTDNEVFLVVRRDPLDKSSVHTIVNKMNSNSKTALDEELASKAIEWAQKNIREYIERGCDAEEYLFAKMRYIAILNSIADDAILAARNGNGLVPKKALFDILNTLGLDRWLDSSDSPIKNSPSEKEKSRIRNLAAAVFARLIELRLNHVTADSESDQQEYIVRHLSLEII
jgi:hypothetical protein